MNTPFDKSRIQIGAVSYLNSKPLVYGLAEAAADFADLSFDVPSRLATGLDNRSLDVGLIPAIEYFRHPERKIVSNACIACCGPVWSVQVLFRRAPQDIRTLAVDEGSRTSVALAQILLKERCHVSPELQLLPLNSPIATCSADAILVIGDRAMHLDEVEDQFAARWDLGQTWFEHTGLPFVFAAWVAAAEITEEPLASVLSQQRDVGLANVDTIAQQHAAAYQLTVAQVRSYLTEFLRFTLGEDELAGLAAFRRKAIELKIAPDLPSKSMEERVTCR